MNFGFKLFLFVRQQIEFNIRVRTTTHIHGWQFCSLHDAHYQLEMEDIIERDYNLAISKSWGETIYGNLVKSSILPYYL